MRASGACHANLTRERRARERPDRTHYPPETTRVFHVFVLGLRSFTLASLDRTIITYSMTPTSRRSHEEESSLHLLHNQKSVINQPLRPIPSLRSATFFHHFVTFGVEQPHWKHNLVTRLYKIDSFCELLCSRCCNTQSLRLHPQVVFSTTSAPRVCWSSSDSSNVQPSHSSFLLLVTRCSRDQTSEFVL